MFHIGVSYLSRTMNQDKIVFHNDFKTRKNPQVQQENPVFLYLS